MPNISPFSGNQPRAVANSRSGFRNFQGRAFKQDKFQRSQMHRKRLTMRSTPPEPVWIWIRVA
jgi:hypothetical protein